MIIKYNLDKYSKVKKLKETAVGGVKCIQKGRST